VEDQGILIEAPSALLGFFLTLRLHGHDARVVESGDGHWMVRVDSGAPREWVLGCVQRWLDDEALDTVVVHVEGETYTMHAGAHA
jgi:hypothetical protein